VGGALLLASAAVFLVAADKPSQQEARQRAMKAHSDGNWKDAYESLRKLALDPGDDADKVSQDLNTGIHCLQQLGRVDEIDEFREGVIKAHDKNWRLLETAATTYTNVQHDGYIIAGKFERGGRHGGKGRYVNAFQRDRVRSLQLMQQALEMTEKESDKLALSKFHLHFADLVLNGGGYYEPWRLQYLTNLKELPDYADGWYYGGGDKGAPVDAKGDPVYHHVPKSYKTAASDGERWRWLLTQAVEFDANLANEVDMKFGNFMRSQLGEQTMVQFGFRGRQQVDDGKENTSGTYALHTLSDEETIARLATGIKRFKVPDEFNWIKIYQRVAGRGKSAWGEQARDLLANIYEDRRQYVKAVEAWNKAIEEYGPGHEGFRQKRFEQIVGNWGRFEPIQGSAAGKKATVDFRFRNGEKVSFEAFAIKVPKLLEDVKAFLRTQPGRVDWEQSNIENLGYRLVEKQQNQYLGDKVASWDLKLKPRPEHVDDRVTVTTPLEKPGAYLLTAKMEGGNTSRIIIWISDSAIVKKQLEGKAFYFIADAATGKPIPKADAEFFGWKWVPIKPGANQYHVETKEFTSPTPASCRRSTSGSSRSARTRAAPTASATSASPASGTTGFTIRNTTRSRRSP
jgi:hypothetical protein